MRANLEARATKTRVWRATTLTERGVVDAFVTVAEQQPGETILRGSNVSIA